MLALAALGFACIVLLMGFVYYKETHLPPIGDSDVIIVLGAQVKEDGTPSVALERRLTAAHESYLADRQLIIVCGAQGGNEPRLSDLRESGSIEQDADVVLLLHRPDGQEREVRKRMQVRIAKNRQRSTGVCGMVFDGAVMRFYQTA